MTTRSSPGHLSPLLKQSSGVTAERGEGAYLFDKAGNRYLDFTSGIGVTSTGHCHPQVVEAAQRQAGRLIHGQYTTVMHGPLLELAERLGERLPGALDALFFASAGTEAVEAALRLCRHATGRPNLVVFHGGFHGRTLGALSLTTSKVGLRAGLQPMMAGVFVAPFPHAHYYAPYGLDEETTTRFCLRELDRLFATQTQPDETAALVIEPVQGEGGYVPASAAFMQGLRERCDRHGILLVADEIQAGYGRTGRFWSHEHFGVEPDLLVTAKGLASGFPLSAFAAPESLMARGRPGSQGGTYGGNAVACAAAVATLQVIEEEGLVENAADAGAHLRRRLDQVAAAHPEVADVRGLGLMLGTEIVDAEGAPDGQRTARLIREAESRGVLFLRCGPDGEVLRWLPPLVVTRDEIDRAVDTFTEALEATAP